MRDVNVFLSGVSLRRRLLLIAALVLAVPAAAETKSNRISRILQAYTDTGRFQGSVLVADRGEVILQKGYGMANLELNVPNRSDTKFRIGSLTKQFTAMLILQLAAEGKLKLDGKLSDYLPEYPKAAAERITIHQLLSHQSGIASYTTPDFMARRARDSFTPLELASVFWDRDLEFEPGSKYAYSNSGYHVLGLIVERMTGKSYEQVLKERILDALEMPDTGYDHTEAILSNRASGYTKTPDGVENATWVNMSIPFAAGGLCSTAPDLRKWDAALYTEKLVPHRYLELAFEPAAKFPDGGGYGYGWMLGSRVLPVSKRHLPVQQHFGGIPGFTSMIIRLPEDRSLIVILANILGSEWGGVSNSIIQILYGEPAEIPKPSMADALARGIRARGVDGARRECARRDELDAVQGEINTLGYYYLRGRRLSEAVAVFECNASLFAKAWNVYDSLGEAYAASGDRERALASYRKAIELNPTAVTAQKALTELERK
ncbi:MAG: serine hydrolase [Bryobacteraceae bacterium]|nr:serine hydrolase [Bryobacteraceae bacterium]